MTPVTNGSAVTTLLTAPARTAPAVPPPTRYRTARTLRKPGGTAAPLTPSPKVISPVAWSTTNTRSSGPNPARLSTSCQLCRGVRRWCRRGRRPGRRRPRSRRCRRGSAPGSGASGGGRASGRRAGSWMGSSGSSRIVRAAVAATVFSRSPESTGGVANEPCATCSRSHRSAEPGRRAWWAAGGPGAGQPQFDGAAGTQPAGLVAGHLGGHEPAAVEYVPAQQRRRRSGSGVRPPDAAGAGGTAATTNPSDSDGNGLAVPARPSHRALPGWGSLAERRERAAGSRSGPAGSVRTPRPAARRSRRGWPGWRTGPGRSRRSPVRSGAPRRPGSRRGSSTDAPSGGVTVNSSSAAAAVAGRRRTPAVAGVRRGPSPAAG